MTGICCLCGAPSNGPYCHAHSWAAGAETDAETPARDPRVEHDTNAITDLVERATPEAAPAMQTEQPQTDTANVRCPECGVVRIVGKRHARRIKEGLYSGVCGPCRFTSNMSAPKATRYYRWWLEQYGVELQPDEDPAEWVLANGLPDGLYELACGVDAAVDPSRFAPDHSQPARRHRRRHQTELHETYEEAA